MRDFTENLCVLYPWAPIPVSRGCHPVWWCFSYWGSDGGLASHGPPQCLLASPETQVLLPVLAPAALQCRTDGSCWLPWLSWARFLRGPGFGWGVLIKLSLRWPAEGCWSWGGEEVSMPQVVAPLSDPASCPSCPGGCLPWSLHGYCDIWEQCFRLT